MSKPEVYTSRSRYGDERKFTVKGNKIVMEGRSNFSRFAMTQDGEEMQMVDLEGGPYMVVGMDLSLVGCPVEGKIDKLTILDDKREYYVKIEIEFSKN